MCFQKIIQFIIVWIQQPGGGGGFIDVYIKTTQEEYSIFYFVYSMNLMC